MKTIAALALIYAGLKVLGVEPHTAEELIRTVVGGVLIGVSGVLIWEETR